jgi:hypothetical protein
MAVAAIGKEKLRRTDVAHEFTEADNAALKIAISTVIARKSVRCDI